MSYLTDGTHLYEIVREMQNFGMRGGWFVMVRDCRTESERIMGDLEAALCSTVAA